VVSALAQVASFGANLVFLLSLLLFMGVDSAGVGPRMTSITAHRPLFAAALRNFAVRTRRFLGVTTVFGLITGFADTLLLLWLGIPLAVLWGLLAALCNYIPYVGFVIGVLPPAVLALLSGGLPLMIFVIVAYILLNALFTSLIQPYFIGDAVGVSTTMTMVALVLWGWVLGPLGAILAIPLTLLCKAVLVDADPKAAWVNALIGSGRSDRVAPATRLRWPKRAHGVGRK
jgi:AI-2 transport protein TqsA